MKEKNPLKNVAVAETSFDKKKLLIDSMVCCGTEFVCTTDLIKMLESSIEKAETKYAGSKGKAKYKSDQFIKTLRELIESLTQTLSTTPKIQISVPANEIKDGQWEL